MGAHFRYRRGRNRATAGIIRAARRTVLQGGRRAVSGVAGRRQHPEALAPPSSARVRSARSRHRLQIMVDFVHQLTVGADRLEKITSPLR
jgi:hypothetical protein